MFIRAAVFLILTMVSSAFGSDSPSKSILFFGDSLAAGYGLDNAASESFPALIGQKLREARLPYEVVNGGLSGDTTAGGLRRIDWMLRARPVDILVLELGGNDGLRGISPDDSTRNLQAIIDKVRAKNPPVRIIIAGMMMPPNFGADFVTRFAAMYPALQKANPGAELIPFILAGVGGDPSLNQRDRIHPTAAGHRVIADLVWKTLEPMVRAP